MPGDALLVRRRAAVLPAYTFPTLFPLKRKCEVPRCPLWRRFRRKSGRNADLVESTRLTQGFIWPFSRVPAKPLAAARLHSNIVPSIDRNQSLSGAALKS